MAVSLNPSTSAKRIFVLRIELQHVKPLVWRRVTVPQTVKLKKLDRIIQTAMGWTNSHLHAFHIKDRRYGAKDLDDWGMDSDLLDDKRYAIGDVLEGIGFEFEYVYDFGDDWVHRVTVQGLEEATPLNNWPMCLAGANACPPEDVGGSPGYAMFQQAMADLGHPEHEHYWRWVGGPFDPSAFDMNLVNQRIRKLR